MLVKWLLSLCGHFKFFLQNQIVARPSESPSLVLDNWWNPSTNLYAKCV